ncbi:NAD(P)-dependent alcohol dehydrogenase [Fulvivirgaceae bacterium BMA12]|uniref:NAD(P)-dependent alcohol dehydrogenase n=1 Tax=Agaribacillus aureus TaxID=3051825 RepID=A0ABT8L6G6_9BACT|nr:NAD(P)-dependent alcohol dehydrogenase [Fulvivirgaceae bacterium BMA12]
MSMKAIGINENVSIGNLVDKLQEFNCERPQPKKGEVLIQVNYSTINIDDIHAMEGSMMGGFRFKPKASKSSIVIPGSDVAGVVKELGQGVTKFEIGQRVYGICPMNQQYGPWAEFCISKVEYLSATPHHVSDKEMVALPIAGTMAARSILAVKTIENKSCLVIGAAGGIGALCTQVLAAKKATVYGICSTKNKNLVSELGAHEVLTYDSPDFHASLESLGGKINVVFDFVGGKARERMGRKVLIKNGIYITVVGPNEWIGQKKLNVFQMTGMFLHILRRMAFSKLLTGRSYKFVTFKAPLFSHLEKDFATGSILSLNQEVSFTSIEIKKAIERVLKHNTVGRVIIKVADEIL